jgi:glyoxylase-like metal-dependent hydrolase (beta-lactamase superfamily II)
MVEFKYKPLVLGAIATNCWIVPLDDPAPSGEHPGGENLRGKQPCAVIDPADEANLIIARLEEYNLFPQYILLTHGHFDHLAALPDLVAAFSQDGSPGGWKPEIVIHGADQSYLGPWAHDVHVESFRAAAGNSSYVDKLWKPMPAPTRLLWEGDIIGPFKVLHLPGHTPGSVGFFWETQGSLFSGDTLFKDGYGRTDLPGGDWNQLEKSLRRLLSMDRDIKVYPGHGESTTIGAALRDH